MLRWLGRHPDPKRLPATLELLSDPVFETDLEGRFLYVNRAALERFGYDSPEGVRLLDTVVPEERERARTNVGRVLAGEQLGPMDYRMLRRDGSSFRARIHSAPVLSQGRPVGLQGVIVDIDRDAAAEQLRASEERLRLLFEESPLGILQFDEQGRVLDCNERLPTLFGARRADIVGVDVLAHGHPVIRAALREALERGEGRFEGEFQSGLSGRRVSMRVTYRVVRDARGRFRAGMGVYEDVGERLRAERELAQREEQLRTLLGAMPDIVCFKDGEGRWLEANPFDLDLFGLTGIAYQGKKDSELAAHSPFYREAFLACEESDENAWREGRMSRGEETIPRPDGSALVFDIIKVPLFNPDGSRRGLLVIGRDITERKRIEERLLQSQKLEAVGRLAGGIAHDFNNLLTAIGGFAELAAQGTSEPTTREHLREVLASAARAADLTRQLLAFSRRQIVQPRVIGLNALVEHMRALLRRLIGAPIDLRICAVAHPDRVRVDPGQLEQVLLNLAINARDAMPRGGVLEIATAARALDAAAAHRHDLSPGPYLALTVSDTGVGMDASVCSQIFEPFFTTKGKGEGTGLGLATAYGIVRQAGGQILVQSAVGKGSIFTVLLPSADEPLPVPPPELEPKEDADRPGATVMIVEDEEVVRLLGAEILRREGYQVLVAAGGREALERARVHPGAIDLLFTDVVLPDLTGREVAEAVAAQRPGLRVLYTSGYTDHAIVRDMELEGGLDFLHKPYPPGELLRRVRAALRDAR